MPVNTYAEETRILKTVLKDGMDVDFPSVKILIPNQKEPSKGSWVRFNLVNGTANQQSIGGVKNLHRHLGILIVQIFVEYDSGDAAALEIADKICGYYQGFQEDSLVCRTPYLVPAGKSLNWYQFNVNVPFYRDAIK